MLVQGRDVWKAVVRRCKQGSGQCSLWLVVVVACLCLFSLVQTCSLALRFAAFADVLPQE